VLLSDGFWQRRFGGDRSVVGRTLSLDGRPYIVIGIMPRAFGFATRADLWQPLAADPTSCRGDHRLGVVGRLRSGVTIDAATADMRAIARQLAEQYPASNAEWGVRIESFQDWFVGPELRGRVIALLFAVGLLLAMACVNVANLLIARASTREREMGVRAALGAGRWRITRQLLTESLTLAAIGAAVGILLAALAMPMLRRIGGDAVSRLDEMSFDWRVLGFAIGASLVTGLLFGLAPAAVIVGAAGNVVSNRRPYDDAVGKDLVAVRRPVQPVHAMRLARPANPQPHGFRPRPTVHHRPPQKHL
jgi:putative ABC transport system permease protein